MNPDQNTVSKILVTTSMALNIALVTTTLVTMYRKRKGKKTCNCKSK